MKKMIILVGLLSAFTIKAETYLRVPVSDLTPVENMYASFEVQTPKFEKVILDCQSLIHELSFYQSSKVIRKIRMVDYFTCENIHNFIVQSKMENKSVCMEVAEESNALTLSNDDASDCQ